MLHPPFLAANFEAWATGIFLLTMGFFWLINQISTAVEVARRPPPVRRPPQPAPPPADGPQQPPQMPRQRMPGPQGQPRPAADALQSEIDEFLRRATGRREPVQPGEAQRQRPGAPRPAVPAAKSDPRRSRGTPVVARPKPVATAPGEAAETPEAISEHVKQFLDTREFDQRTAKLSSIDEKERQFDEKVQQTFSHELGHLKSSTLSAGGDSAVSAAAFQQPPPPAPTPLANLLRNPADLKRAIVLNEIFQRPEHRW